MLLVRADSGRAIGTGHIMRCLALTEAWRGLGYETLLLTSGISDLLRDRVATTGTDVMTLDVEPASGEDAAFTAHLAATRAPAWVVIDGYGFDLSFQETVKQSGRKVLVIDDTGHLPRYRGDILLNQNLYAQREMYASSQVAKFLLGPRYALLRNEFVAARREERRASARNILVTFGGADEHNITERAILAVASLRDRYEVTVLVGALSAEERRLRVLADELGLDCEWLMNSSSVAEVMAWADVAITGAGSTCWELAFMGTPMICVVVADNQRAIAESLVSAGAAVDAGWHAEVTPTRLAELLSLVIGDPHKLEKMRDSGIQLIDGRGSARVVDEMVRLV